MTQELQGLKENLLNIIKERGLDLFCKSYDGMSYTFSFNNSCYLINGKRNGLELYLDEVYRNNGTNRNHSFCLIIHNFKNGCGRVLGKAKISDSFSIEKQTRLANEIIDKFIELVNNSI